MLWDICTRGRCNAVTGVIKAKWPAARWDFQAERNTGRKESDLEEAGWAAQSRGNGVT